MVSIWPSTFFRKDEEMYQYHHVGILATALFPLRYTGRIYIYLDPNSRIGSSVCTCVVLDVTCTDEKILLLFQLLFHLLNISTLALTSRKSANKDSICGML